MTELESYPWTGHAAVLGKCKSDWLDSDFVPSLFDNKISEAQTKYRNFIGEGLDPGNVFDDYEGGGLVRSNGGRLQVCRLLTERNCRLGDERILGGSDFVQAALDSYDKNIEIIKTNHQQEHDFENVVIQVCKHCRIQRSSLFRRGRYPSVVLGRALLAYWCIKELGMSTVDLAEVLGLSHQGISKAVRRGQSYVESKHVAFLER